MEVYMERCLYSFLLIKIKDPVDKQANQYSRMSFVINSLDKKDMDFVLKEEKYGWN